MSSTSDNRYVVTVTLSIVVSADDREQAWDAAEEASYRTFLALPQYTGVESYEFHVHDDDSLNPPTPLSDYPWGDIAPVYHMDDPRSHG